VALRNQRNDAASAPHGSFSPSMSESAHTKSDRSGPPLRGLGNDVQQPAEGVSRIETPCAKFRMSAAVGALSTT